MSPTKSAGYVSVVPVTASGTTTPGARAASAPGTGLHFGAILGD